MESKTVTVCIFVAVLGIAAAVAGFAADEATKAKKSQPTVVYVGDVPECEYPSSPAMGLAIAAAMAIVLARAVITSTTGGCCSCCQSIPNLATLARVCIVISWITSIVAVILFLAGARASSHKGVAREIEGKYSCYTLRPRIFLGAGIMGLVSVLLAILYYLSYVSAKNDAAKTSEKELELEAPPIIDGKKPPMADDKIPSIVVKN